MRRLVRAQQDAGETSQSDWSEDDEARELMGEGGPEGDTLSMAANGGLTDAEGALSGNLSGGGSRV